MGQDAVALVWTLGLREGSVSRAVEREVELPPFRGRRKEDPWTGPVQMSPIVEEG